MNPIERLLDIIRAALPKEIDEKRCFVLTRKAFYEALHLMAEAGMGIEGDPTLLRKHKMDNFELSLTTGDTAPYYICTPADPIIDTIWEAKKK